MDFKNYRKLYHKFRGDKIIDDTRKSLENFKRVSILIGDSFPDNGHLRSDSSSFNNFSGSV